MTTQLAPDPAVPARDELLDPAGAARVLARGLRRPIDSCAIRRVKYRVGESLRVLYEVELGTTRTLVASRHAPGTSHDLYARASTAAAATSELLPPVAHDPRSETVLWAFPNDRRLHALPLVADPAASAALTGVAVATTRLAAYAPEKAATFRCDGGSGTATAYVKAYGDVSGAATAGFHHAIARSGCDLQVPRVLALAADGCVLAVEPLDGPCVGELRGRALGEAARRLGAALARLHALAPPDAPAFSRHDPVAVERAAELVGRARPDVAGPLRELAETLGRAAPTGPARAWLHGDVHLKNAIVTDAGLGLIDLDQVATGPAEADLGSLLASIRAQRVCGSLPPGTARQVEQAILTGYASEGTAYDPAALRWHTSAALVTERVLRAVNRVRPDALARLGALVAEAQRSLGSPAR